MLTRRRSRIFGSFSCLLLRKPEIISRFVCGLQFVQRVVFASVRLVWVCIGSLQWKQEIKDGIYKLSEGMNHCSDPLHGVTRPFRCMLQIPHLSAVMLVRSGVAQRA